MSTPWHSLPREDLIAYCLRFEAMAESIAALREDNQRLAQRVAQLERELAAARKDSSNSSKPPSSDIVKPRKDAPGPPGTRRPRGAQDGHAMHDRPPFAADQVKAAELHVLTCCPCCGGPVQPTDNAPRVVQKVELIQQPAWEVTQHEAHAFWCGRCARVHHAPLPAAVERGGMLGPKALGLIAYLKAVHHASFSTLRTYCRDVLGLSISRGRLAKAVQQVSQALRRTHEELAAALPSQPTLRVDETGHKDEGRRHWTWCFRAEAFTWFRIDPSRGSKVLLEVLGEEFEGVLHCDYFSAYRKYMGDCDVRVQFCLAHLIRDLKFLTTLPAAATAAYGRGLLEAVRAMFAIIHEGPALSPAPPGALQRRLAQARQRVVAAATTAVPATPEAEAMARRFREHGPAYFEFITTPGAEPTNNLAEQALRFVVIDRRITQGTRGDKGQRWCERVWTVVATCAQQGRSALEFLTQAATAWANDLPPPSLLPAATA